MDRPTLVRAIQELDKLVTAPAELVIVGGAAMIMHFGALRATMDVDVLIDPKSTRNVKSAAREVAMKMNLAEDWLNDG